MKLSLNILGTLALLLAFGASGMAFEGDTDPDKAQEVCGKIVPVKEHKSLIAAQGCSCAGSATITVTAIGTYTNPGHSLVCETHSYTPPYDGFAPGGEILCKPDRHVDNVILSNTCDTSDCWDFLIFGGGTAVCEQTVVPTTGGGWAYLAVGNCPPEAPKAKD